MAFQQPGALQVAQHRVQRALLAAQHALAHPLQLLGNEIAVQRLPGPGQHRQQGQRHGSGAELLLELLQVDIVFDHDLPSTTLKSTVVRSSV